MVHLLEISETMRGMCGVKGSLLLMPALLEAQQVLPCSSPAFLLWSTVKVTKEMWRRNTEQPVKVKWKRSCWIL